MPTEENPFTTEPGPRSSFVDRVEGALRPDLECEITAIAADPDLDVEIDPTFVDEHIGECDPCQRMVHGGEGRN